MSSFPLCPFTDQWLRLVCRSGLPVYVSFQNTPSPSFFFGINQQGVLAEMGWFLYPSFSFVNWQAQWWERKRTKDRAVVTGRGWERGSLPVTLCPGLISTLSCRPNFKVLQRSSPFLTKSWWKGRKELWPPSTCRQVTLLFILQVRFILLWSSLFWCCPETRVTLSCHPKRGGGP